MKLRALEQLFFNKKQLSLTATHVLMVVWHQGVVFNLVLQRTVQCREFVNLLKSIQLQVGRQRSAPAHLFWALHLFDLGLKGREGPRVEVNNPCCKASCCKSPVRPVLVFLRYPEPKGETVPVCVFG